MIEVSEAATSILTRSFTYGVQVDAYYNGLLIASDIPVSSASEETDSTLKVPERVSFTVPRLDRGTDWTPTAIDDPLAANGQRLVVTLKVGNKNQPELIQRGEFLIHDSTPQGDDISVTAVGLLSLIDEARLVSPYQPSGTLVSTLRGLLEPALTVTVDSSLTDRSVPSGINMDEDRLQAVLDLLDAWPATAVVVPEGFLSVMPATQSTTSVLTLTDQVGGTVITATGTSTRDGAYSVVVARGTAPDGGQLQGAAYVASGPQRFGGPFNALAVPYFYQSPLLTTIDQCNQAAATILSRKMRNVGLSFSVSMVPNPTLQMNDVVTLVNDQYPRGVLCSIQALTLPYTSSGGAMSLTVVTI